MIVELPIGWEQRVTHAIGHLAVLGVGDEGGRDRRIHPHAAAALLEQREIFVEPVRRSARGASFGHQINVIGQRLIPFGAVELGLPVLVEPAAAH